MFLSAVARPRLTIPLIAELISNWAFGGSLNKNEYRKKYSKLLLTFKSKQPWWNRSPTHFKISKNSAKQPTYRIEIFLMPIRHCLIMRTPPDDCDFDFFFLNKPIKKYTRQINIK